MSVAVLSSLYGDYDHVDPPPHQTVEAEWIMVTDQDVDVPGWTVVKETRPHMHPRMAAKVAKCLPFRYTNADTTVWLDASCRLLRSDALSLLIKESKGAPMAQIVHPWRDDIVDEAEASAGMPKYHGQPVREQVEYYTSRGYPRHAGLFATGLIVRNDPNDAQAEFGLRWLAEQCAWTYQDQLSQMPVLASMRLQGRPLDLEPLPFDLHGSGVFEWHNHRDDQ